MQIQKVSLVNGGLKGISVSYCKVEDKGGFHFNNEHVSKFKSPINTELQEAFKTLRKHVKAICNISAKTDEEQIEVTGLKYDGESFLITSKMTVLDNQIVALNTPLVDASSTYKEYDQVVKVCDSIYEEVVAYIEKKKVMDPKQFVMDFYQKQDKNFDPSEFESMAEGDLRAHMKAALEKTGCVIMDRDDFSEGEAVEAEATPSEEDSFSSNPLTKVA